MSRLLWIFGLIGAVLLMVAPVAAQQAPPTTYEFIERDNPVALIGAYYNAVSRGEYDRAYAYWEQAPGNQTAAQFAAGFADTAAVRALVYLPVVPDAGAGNVHAQMPTFVTAYKRDGTVAYYAGCLTAHKTNVPVGNATEPDPNWYLQQGTLSQQQSVDLTVLDSVCSQTDTLQSGDTFLGQLDPADLISSYFSAMATGGITAGASYWETPPDLYAQLYGQTAPAASRLRLFVNPEIQAQGAAGSIYADIPALLMATGTDNVVRYVAGCYIARMSDVPVGNATQPDPNWHFNNVSLSLTLDVNGAINRLAQNCTP